MRFSYILKERAGIEEITNEQIRDIKRLVKESRRWDAEKRGKQPLNIEKMHGEEYDKLWDVNMYIICETDKEKLKNLDQKTIFNNMQWLSRNAEKAKMDIDMKKFLGMHVWVISHWISMVGRKTIRKFLRENNYTGDFVYFLYRYFNL